MDDDEAAAHEAQRAEDAEDDFESYERLLHMSVADRSRLEVQGGSAGLPFEGDERLQIPAGTNETLARAIRNYWSVWSKQRDAVLERHAEAQKRADEFRKGQRKAPSARALANLQRTDRAAFAAFDAEAQFAMLGGPLGVEMMSFGEDIGPIDPSEIAAIAVAAEDALRARPPVRVCWVHVVQPDPGYGLVDDGEEIEPGAIIAGEEHAVALSVMGDIVPAAEELRRAFNNTVRPEESRPAYTRFAAQFWYPRLGTNDGTKQRQIAGLVDVGPTLKYKKHPASIALMQLMFDAANKAILPVNDAGYPTQNLPQPEADVDIEIRPPGSPAQASPELRERLLREIFARMDERDFDTWILMEANWIVNKDGDGGAWISRNKLLEARGRKAAIRKDGGKPYQDGFRTRDRNEVPESIGRLESIVLRVSNVRMRGRKKVAESITSRAFAVTDTCSQREFKGFGAEEIIEAWYYQPGKVFRTLGSDSRRLQIAQVILQLDPLHHRWEKRLAQYWSSNMNPTRVTRTRIGDVLDITRLHSQKNPERDRRQFVKALKNLVDAGVFGMWRYVGHRAGDENKLPARGGHAEWLRWEVEITPPALQLA